MTELEEYFTFRCLKGLEDRGLSDKPEYRARLEYEMATIIKMGFPGYFLIVWDILNWARSQGILCGPGRGSVAGSLVSYCLYITSLDPIQFGLIFERFLNPDRISMPDIDMDFPDDKRHLVIDYVRQKYGADRVANIGTFGQMKARGAVKAAARTLGTPQYGEHLAKFLLKPVHGKPQPIKLSLELVKELQDLSADETKVMHWAQKIENIFSSVGVHASGIVISNESLYDTVPLFKGRSGEVTTQWDMNRVEDYGLVKFDFLGLKTLTKVQETLNLIEQRRGIKVPIETISLEDEPTYEMLRAGHTAGIFQMETSSGMRDLLVRIRPTSLEDITALVAIFRPGPLDSDYKDVYLAVRAGTMEPQYLVPELEPILKKTAGWLIYQEQVLDIARMLCGYTYGEADLLRRAIGKKKEKELAAGKERFMKGWTEHGLTKDTGEVMWDQIRAFADYAFNKSHAASYALVSYWTAYLKTHYPAEFMCANLIHDRDNTDQVIKYIAECKRLGIEILPPHVNIASASFSIEGDNKIRFGLGPIKNLGEGPVSMITDERRNNGEFKSFLEFCQRVDLGIINRLKIESLAKAGALDGLGPNRASLLAAVNNYWEYKKNKKSYEAKLETYTKKRAAYHERLEQIAAGAKLKPFKEPVAPVEPVVPSIPNHPEMPMQERMGFEHELLGFFVTDHPLEAYLNTIEVEGLSTIEQIKTTGVNGDIALAGVISSISEITTKKKANMAFLYLEDLTGQIEAVVFPGTYAKFQDLIGQAIPRKFVGSIEETEGEEEIVHKLIVKSISELKTYKGVPRKRKLPAIHIEIPVEKISGAADLLESHRGGDQDVTISIRLGDGSLIKFKEPISVAERRTLVDQIHQYIE